VEGSGSMVSPGLQTFCLFFSIPSPEKIKTLTVLQSTTVFQCVWQTPQL